MRYFEKNTATTTYTGRPRPTEIAANKPADKQGTRPEVKYREPGQCMYCGQRWFIGHKCAQYKNLNLMATKETELVLDEQMQNIQYQQEDEQPSTSPNIDEPLMLISMQAVKGRSTTATFHYVGRYWGQKGPGSSGFLKHQHLYGLGICNKN